jgi:hypothetical protein
VSSIGVGHSFKMLLNTADEIPVVWCGYFFCSFFIKFQETCVGWIKKILPLLHTLYYIQGKLHQKTEMGAHTSGGNKHRTYGPCEKYKALTLHNVAF